MTMDVINCQTSSSAMQFVEIELDPQEAVIGEAGSLMDVASGIAMDTLFGDGSAQQGGFFGKLMDAVKRLVTGESLRVNSGCVVAYTPDVSFDIQYVGKIKTALFGGGSLFLAKMTESGHIWLQSLPFSRLASRIFAAAPQNGSSKEQRSLFAGDMLRGAMLGDMLGGGNNE